MSIDIFLLLHISFIKFKYFNPRFWFFVFCYSFVKGPPSLVSAICSQRTALLVYLFLSRKADVLITRFVYKRPQSLSLAIHLQRTGVLVFWLFIFKGLLSLSSAIYLQKTVVLVLCYSFAKDRSLCLVVYICKGLLSLPCAIRLQRTVVLVLCSQQN